MKFSRLQISFVLLLSIGISNHVLILPQLLNVARRDAWVCVLIAYLILVIWGTLIFWIQLKIGDEKIYLWIKERAGATFSKVIKFIFILYILISGLISSYDLIEMIKIFFLPQTPRFVVVFCFLFLCLWIADAGLKVIGLYVIIPFASCLDSGSFCSSRYNE